MSKKPMKERRKTNMKNKHIWIPLFIFLGAGIVSLITSIIDFKVVNPALAYSAQTIQFDYDGASEGKDPDGNIFDPVGFLSDDILEAALTKSELNISVDDVRPYIAMENVVPQNLLKELTTYEKVLSSGDDGNNRPITSKDYHPVRYRFVVYQNKMIPQGKLNKFVENIVDEYNDTFYATYKKSFVQETYNDLFNIDNYDYIYQSQIYVARINILMNYAASIQAEHEDFTYLDTNGTTKSFNDLILKGQQLISTDSSKINNIIILNALSKDVDRLKGYYTYLLEQLNYDKVKYTSDYDAVTIQLIGTNQEDTEDGHKDDYAINPTVYVGTGENVIQVQDDTAVTYNNLLSKQIGLKNTINGINKTITDYTDILDKLNHAVPGSTAEATVNNMLIQLGQDYKDLDEFFHILVEAYNAKYVKEGVTSKTAVKYSSTSIFSSSFIVHTVKVAAPIMLTTMLGIVIFYLVRAIKKEKEAKTV